MKQILLKLVQEVEKLNNNIRPPILSQRQHYSIETVAEMFECHVNTVRSWIKDGNLQTFQYKGTIRIRENQLERFITKHTG
jgi:excisionase family DNA binding protein